MPRAQKPRPDLMPTAEEILAIPPVVDLPEELVNQIIMDAQRQQQPEVTKSSSSSSSVVNNDDTPAKKRSGKKRAKPDVEMAEISPATPPPPSSKKIKTPEFACVKLSLTNIPKVTTGTLASVGTLTDKWVVCLNTGFLIKNWCVIPVFNKRGEIKDRLGHFISPYDALAWLKANGETAECVAYYSENVYKKDQQKLFGSTAVRRNTFANTKEPYFVDIASFLLEKATKKSSSSGSLPRSKKQTVCCREVITCPHPTETVSDELVSTDIDSE